MKRRVFISCQHEDKMQGKGFNLLQWNTNVDFDISCRHLLDRLPQKGDAFIEARIREQMKGTSVTVVICGEKTAQSAWVPWEIEETIAAKKGLLAVRLDPTVELPQGLIEAGAEIVDWHEGAAHEFEDAIERAAIAARRVPAMVAAAASAGNAGCMR